MRRRRPRRGSGRIARGLVIHRVSRLLLTPYAGRIQYRLAVMGAGRWRMRFTWQILLMQVAVVVLLLGVGFGLVAWLLRDELTDQFGQRALTVGRALAADPEVAEGAAVRRRGGDLQGKAERIRAATGALVVVITDDRGIRLAHRSPDRIGKPVSTDPSEALAGREVVSVVEEGTLGRSVRSKVPIRAASGRVVGEVSVSFRVEDVTSRFTSLLGSTAVFAGGALLVGLAAAGLLTRRLRRLTLGLEPYELAELVSEREAVLYGIGEGVLAVDRNNRVSACNGEARRLLDLPTGSDTETTLDPVGAPVDRIGLTPRLLAAVSTGDEVDNLVTVAGERVLVTNVRPVRRGERSLGVVVTLRDRTELESLTRELDVVRTLSDGLRAQRHETANRMHALSGLLQLGHHAQAVEYLQQLTDQPADAEDFDVADDADDADRIEDPYLRSLLASKSVVARESGVRLWTEAENRVAGMVRDPVLVTTVVGNLVDNAVAAAAGRRPGTVEVSLAADNGDLFVSVADSGDGVPESLATRVFVEGVSTKDEPGHGLGLALARQAAVSTGGGLWLVEVGGPENGGACFAAELRGIFAAGNESDAEESR